MTITITDETTSKVLSSDKLDIPADLTAEQAVSTEGIARVIARQVNEWTLIGDGLQRVADDLGVTFTGMMRVPSTDGRESHFAVPVDGQKMAIDPRVRLLSAARAIAAENGAVLDESGLANIVIPTAGGGRIEAPVLLAELS